MEAVVEAARNRTLPPVPPGWTESIDPYTEEVVYVNSRTGARVNIIYITTNFMPFYDSSSTFFHVLEKLFFVGVANHQI